MTLAEGNLKIPKCQACRETGLEIQITLLLGFIICDFFECYSMNKQWNFKIRAFDSTTSGPYSRREQIEAFKWCILHSLWTIISFYSLVVFLYFHKNLSFVIIDRAKVRSSYGPLAYFCQKWKYGKNMQADHDLRLQNICTQVWVNIC